jgi:hypothetical protein
LLIDRDRETKLLESRKDKASLAFAVLAFPAIPVLWSPEFLFWFSVEVAIVLALFFIAGFGEINLLKWSNRRRAAFGSCLIASLVAFHLYIRVLRPIVLILDHYFLLYGSALLLPSMGAGLILSILSKEVKSQYLLFIATSLLACLAIIYLIPHLTYVWFHTYQFNEFRAMVKYQTLRSWR